MSVTTPSDYVGKQELAISTGNSIQLYIDRYEKKYLIRLFGCDLYNSYVLDPNAARFLFLLNELCIQDDCSEILTSNGLKDMLLGFVYYEYTPDNKIKNTVSGAIVDFNENSRETTGVEADIESRYNESIDSYRAMQYLMKNDPITYPEYNGVQLEYSFFGGAF